MTRPETIPPTAGHRPSRKTPPRDQVAANMMAIGLFVAAGGFIYFWSAFLLYMGWTKEANFEPTYIADTGPHNPWTAGDLGAMVALASGLFGSGAALAAFGVRRMLKISRQRDLDAITTHETDS